jgi:hypothetical protein
MGAMVPDLKVLVYQLLGFCILTGWCCIFPHRRAERRHYPHSRPCKIARTCQAGENRYKWIFASAKLDKYFIISAAIGSLSHVLVDSLHHEDNPLLWLIGPTYFTGPLVVAFGAPLAHSIIAAAAIAIIAFMFKKLLNDSGYGFSLVFRNPIKAMSVVTSVLLV